MKHCLILGTRPEIIKLSPVIRELKRLRAKFFIIHSNQHYSARMDAIFFDELNLPRAKYNLKVGSGTQGEQTAKIIERAEKVLIKEKPDIVYVQGDTNTVLAGALAAAKLQIPVAHVEAGLRSYDRTMPEEINRVVADHISDFLFAPTYGQRKILLEEAIKPKNIFVVGNTIVDAVNQSLKIAHQKSKILEKLKLRPGKFFLLTLHRPANVDEKTALQNVLEGLDSVCQKFNLPIVFPVHPRTKKQVEKFKVSCPAGIKMIEPVGYLEMLILQKESRLIMTDSGGIQEEACLLQKPCVTIRENTERPETVEVGGNILVGNDPKKIFKGVSVMLEKEIRWRNPFGHGDAGRRIVKIIRKNVKTN